MASNSTWSRYCCRYIIMFFYWILVMTTTNIVVIIINVNSDRSAAVNALATPVVVSTTTRPTTTVMNRQKKEGTKLNKETIQSIQTKQEEYLRSVHDNTIFNALFVNVPEYPDPIPYQHPHPQHRYINNNRNDDVASAASSSSSSSLLLPFNFPPGCLLRLGPNGAPRHDGFMDGDGFINCITFPPSLIASASNHDQPNGSGDRKSTMNDDNNDDNSSRHNTGGGGTFSSTYVRTRGRKLEDDSKGTKKFLGTLGSVPYGLPLLQNVITNAINFRTLQCQKDTCNTALGIHDGRILALMEQCPPCEVQVSRDGRVNTIADTVRLDNAIGWSPITGGSLSAHGRTCPITNERVHVSYDGNTAPYIRVDVFDRRYHLQRSIPVNVPCATMVHDSAITNQYIVILDFPLTLRTSRFLKNQFPVEYEPEYGARIGLLPRNAVDDSTIQWFSCQPGIILHIANAYDDMEQNTVIVHALRSEPRDSTKGYLEEFTTSYLYEYELDLLTGTVTQERFLNIHEPVEFPIINPNYVGQPSNPSVYCSSVRSIGGPLLHHQQPVTGIVISGITKFNLQDRGSINGDSNDMDHPNKGDVIDSFVLPLPWLVVSEPTVVPKTDGSGGEYVLLIATKVVEPRVLNNDSTGRTVRTIEDGSAQCEMVSQVVVLDGDHLNDGPVWKCELPHHVHYGLHSLFVDWDSMV